MVSEQPPVLTSGLDQFITSERSKRLTGKLLSVHDTANMLNFFPPELRDNLNNCIKHLAANASPRWLSVSHGTGLCLTGARIRIVWEFPAPASGVIGSLF